MELSNRQPMLMTLKVRTRKTSEKNVQFLTCTIEDPDCQKQYILGKERQRIERGGEMKVEKS